MRTVVFTFEAELDLLNIWNYIAANNLDAGDRVADKIRAEVQRLAEEPGLGHGRQEVNDKSYRFWRVYSYLIVYRYDDRDLIVVRVIHGAQDIGSIFNGGN